MHEQAIGQKRTALPGSMDVAVELRSAREMAGDVESFSPFWLVSSEIGQREATALSQKVLGRLVGHGDLRSGQALPFGARYVLTTKPDIGLMSCFSPAARWPWPTGASAPDLVMVRPADGNATIEQDGRRITLRSREAVLLDLSVETLFLLPQLGRIDLIRLDRARLPALSPAELMQPFPRVNRGLQVLAQYGALLLRGLFPLDAPALRDLAIGHVHDLVGIMMADRSAPPTIPAHGRRLGRLAAIKADIETRLERRDLGLDMIAGLYGVTPRAIQKAFEIENRTFSEYVLERRLERAWQRLTSADERDLPISTVAFEVGFGDLSYFNRSFRKRFGRSPSQARAGTG